MLLFLTGFYILKKQDHTKSPSSEIEPTRDDKDIIKIPFHSLATIWKPDLVMKREILNRKENLPEMSIEEDSANNIVSYETQTKEEYKQTYPDEMLGPFKPMWDKCVEPYIEHFEKQKVMSALKRIIKILHDEGDTPSVVLDSSDSESVNLISVRDNLYKVNLREHSCAVAKNIIDIMKENIRDYENMIPKAVITALAHDLGKIDKFRKTGIYNTAEHPLISKNVLADILADTKPFWKNEALRAVAEHHLPTNDLFTTHLKMADMKAREGELLKTIKDVNPSSDLNDWFRSDELIKEMEKDINYIQTDKWKAFTYRGVVYARPDYVYELASEIAKKKKILDIRFAYESEKEEILKMIARKLRKDGYLLDTVREGYYARRYQIKPKMGRTLKYMLIPIKPGELLNMAELERRKTGYLQIIESVRVS